MRGLIAGLLFVVGSAQAANAPLFSVEDSYGNAAVVGDSVVLPGAETIWTFIFNDAVGADATALTWQAAAGYKITGFTAAYDLFFGGGTFPFPGGPFVSTASFESSDGAKWDFTYPPESQTQLVRQDTAGSQWNVGYSLIAHGLGEFCPIPEPGCHIEAVPTVLRVTSITVTPHVVPVQTDPSAIPEPSTYALMLVGVAFLLNRQNRRGRQPLS
jgi:hypothetical protein